MTTSKMNLREFKNLKKPESKGVLSNQKKLEKQNLTGYIMLRLTEEEKLKIENQANDEGLKTSPFIRHILKKHQHI